jgi:hypothetical protein
MISVRTLLRRFLLVRTGQVSRAAAGLDAGPGPYCCSVAAMAHCAVRGLHCAPVLRTDLRAGGNREHGRRPGELARVVSRTLRRLARQRGVDLFSRPATRSVVVW